MAYPFQRTLRSLSGHQSGTRGVLLILGAMALFGLITWIVGAKIPVLKVSAEGRIEPHNAVHRIEPPEAGRVVHSMLNLDKQVEKGELLIEFDTRETRLELARSRATHDGLTRELSVIQEQIANKEKELEASSLVDAAVLREAAAREQELAPRRRLAEQRAQLAKQSPTGAISEIEKLERYTEADELIQSRRTQALGITRLRREQVVRREALTAQLLGLRRERLQSEGQLEELELAIERLEHQIEIKNIRAPAAGRLVDVVELGAGAYIAQGQRLGTILATGSSQIRVRARFPKETVGIIRPGQTAQLKLDGYPWTIYGTVPATVSRVGTEPGRSPTAEAVPGTVRVELELLGPADPRILLQHGLTTTVEIEVARVSPATLLMRAIGEWNYVAPEPAIVPSRPLQLEAEAR